MKQYITADILKVFWKGSGVRVPEDDYRGEYVQRKQKRKYKLPLSLQSTQCHLYSD